MYTVFALLCFVVVIHWLIFPYPSGLLHWHCGNLTISPVPAKQPWWIWINTSCEFIMNDCITTTKQSTTKPCAYFLGYTVSDIAWIDNCSGNSQLYTKCVCSIFDDILCKMCQTLTIQSRVLDLTKQSSKPTSNIEIMIIGLRNKSLNSVQIKAKFWPNKATTHFIDAEIPSTMPCFCGLSVYVCVCDVHRLVVCVRVHSRLWSMHICSLRGTASINEKKQRFVFFMLLQLAM